MPETAFACKSAKTVDTIAKSSIESIMAKEKARREMKEYRASLGIHDTLEDAVKWMNEHFEEYENPLYITENKDDGRFYVREAVYKDADGIPICSGDTVFLPDDSFCVIRWSVPDDDEPETDTIFWECVPVDGYADRMPSGLEGDICSSDFDGEKEDGVINDSDFRLRAWEETEKQEWLYGIVGEWEKSKQKSIFSRCVFSNKDSWIVGIKIVCLFLAVSTFLVRLLYSIEDDAIFNECGFYAKYLQYVFLSLMLCADALGVLIQMRENKKVRVEAANVKANISEIFAETGELDSKFVRFIYNRYITSKFRIFEEESEIGWNSAHLRMLNNVMRSLKKESDS